VKALAEKYKLNLAIALLVLLGIVWVIWVEHVSILRTLPLLIFVFIAVKWILRDRAKPARLLGFFVKTFTLFLIGTHFNHSLWKRHFLA